MNADEHGRIMVDCYLVGLSGRQIVIRANHHWKCFPSVNNAVFLQYRGSSASWSPSTRPTAPDESTVTRIHRDTCWPKTRLNDHCYGFLGKSGKRTVA